MNMSNKGWRSAPNLRPTEKVTLVLDRAPAPIFFAFRTANALCLLTSCFPALSVLAPMIR
jgi:hypothetical protein